MWDHSIVDQMCIHLLSWKAWRVYYNKSQTPPGMILPQSFLVVTNAKDIDWDSHTPKHDSAVKPLYMKLLRTLSEFSLSQHVREPTREHIVLDFFCSNKPGLVKSVNTVPGVSDHDVVVADSDIGARFTRKVPRKIHLYSKADWNKLRTKTSEFQEEFLKCYSDSSVDENYKKLEKHVNQIIDDHVPSKTTTSRFNVPWMTPTIKRMCRKKQRLYNKAKRTHKSQHWDRFRVFKRDTLGALRKARCSYMNNILQLSLEDNDCTITKREWHSELFTS